MDQVLQSRLLPEEELREEQPLSVRVPWVVHDTEPPLPCHTHKVFEPVVLGPQAYPERQVISRTGEKPPATLPETTTGNQSKGP